MEITPAGAKTIQTNDGIGEAGSRFERVEKQGSRVLRVVLSGDWKLGEVSSGTRAAIADLEREKNISKIVFDSTGLGQWDTGLLAYLSGIVAFGKKQGVAVDTGGLPDGVRRLLDLASKVPERAGARRSQSRDSFFARAGEDAVGFVQGALDLFEFIGECVGATGRLFAGKASFRGQDLLLFLQECGVSSLPIVALISALFGLILAFVGAVQLLMFGAQLYVANLVAIAVVRVMGAVMCGVIMAGRIGAAFAAQLGTMQVNEEIDALKTLAISPVEFLVLPRMIALVAMMPLLCLFADVLGIAGGLVVGVFVLDINLLQYVKQTEASLNLTQFGIGLFHSVVFGVLIAIAGCYKGIKCGRSASAVGAATTSAVVASIVAIVVATALITIMCNVLKI